LVGITIWLKFRVRVWVRVRVRSRVRVWVELTKGQQRETNLVGGVAGRDVRVITCPVLTCALWVRVRVWVMVRDLGYGKGQKGKRAKKVERAKGQKGKRAKGQKGKRATGQKAKSVKVQKGKRAKWQKGNIANGVNGKRAKWQ
jgi:hypothetical protein